MGALNSKNNQIMAASEFDRLFTKNVPHILEEIFFGVDYNSFKLSGGEQVLE